MLSKNQNNRVNEVIDTVLKNMNGLIDVNTVVGSPIENKDNDLIIPVSKVTFGILTGSGEYGKVNLFKSASDLPYTGGNGTVVSVKPCGFLIKDKKGVYKVLTVGTSGVDTILEKTADMVINTIEKENND